MEEICQKCEKRTDELFHPFEVGERIFCVDCCQEIESEVSEDD